MPKIYSEMDKQEAVAIAKRFGVAQTIRDLGWPNRKTLEKWCKDYGVKPDKDRLMSDAAKLGSLFTRAEKAHVLQTQLAKLYVLLQDETLSSMDHKRVSEAIRTTIESLNLIDDKPTHISQSQTKDNTDIELQEMVREAQAALANTHSMDQDVVEEHEIRTDNE